MTGQEASPRRAGHAAAAAPAPAGLFTTDAGTERGVNVRVLRGSPTPDEIAAVTAVLTAAVAEEAANAQAVSSDVPSAWARSQRVLRAPLTAGAGRWRNFTA